VAGVPLAAQAACGDTTSHLFEAYAAATRNDVQGTLVTFVDPSGNLSVSGNGSTLLCTSLTAISSANTTAVTAGTFGHANGVILAAAPGLGYLLELISAVMSYTYATAAYTGGGNISVNIGAGGSALTGVIAAASSVGAGSSNIIQFVPLSTAGFALTANTSINLVAASAFTQPGTAAGTIKVFTTYRIHKL
jgi:hypothetical protein